MNRILDCQNNVKQWKAKQDHMYVIKRALKGTAGNASPMSLFYALLISSANELSLAHHHWHKS